MIPTLIAVDLQGKTRAMLKAKIPRWIIGVAIELYAEDIGFAGHRSEVLDLVDEVRL